jgi:hypothetical protein
VAGGSVGRLVARVPWRAPRAGRAAVSIELCGVEVVACPRPEADWEEGAAGVRALAAKRAALAAAEAERLSAVLAEGGVPQPDASSSAASSSAPPPARGGLASLAAGLVARLVDRLELTVRDVHVRFEGLPDGGSGGGGNGGDGGGGTGATAGLYLALARTAPPAEVAAGLNSSTAALSRGITGDEEV